MKEPTSFQSYGQTPDFVESIFLGLPKMVGVSGVPLTVGDEFVMSLGAQEVVVPPGDLSRL